MNEAQARQVWNEAVQLARQVHRVPAGQPVSGAVSAALAERVLMVAQWQEEQAERDDNDSEINGG